MGRIIIGLIAVVVLLGGGAYVFIQNKAVAPSQELSNNNSIQNQQNIMDSVPPSDNASSTAGQATTLQNSNTSTPDYTPGTFSDGEGEAGAPDIQVFEIDYDGIKFTPSQVTVKAGDYVIFKNSSSVNFWPVSDPHPTHTDYPGFDAEKEIIAGDKYRFQFTKVGNWGFHNHLNPSAKGIVNVTE